MNMCIDSMEIIRRQSWYYELLIYIYLAAKYCLMHVFLSACSSQNSLYGRHSCSTISSTFLLDVFVEFPRRFQNWKKRGNLCFVWLVQRIICRANALSDLSITSQFCIWVSTIIPYISFIHITLLNWWVVFTCHFKNWRSVCSFMWALRIQPWGAST